MRRTGAQRRTALTSVVAVVLVCGTWSWARDETGRQDEESAATGDDCGPTLRESTGGAGAHVDHPTYAAAPPAFGDHADRWEIRADTFYDVGDRPEVAVLVHNLEHGYNILWYDETVGEDDAALSRVRVIAAGYTSLGRTPDPAAAFIAVPWTSADGAAFPDGMHYALTHWYADPTDRTRSRADEYGLTRYCSAISAGVVADWMVTHPLRAAPEGYPDLM